MKALGQLLCLPLVAAPSIGISGLLLYVSTVLVCGLIPDTAVMGVTVPLFVLSIWLFGIAAGEGLSSILIDESRLLPAFSSRLVQAGLLGGLIVSVPVVAAFVLSGHPGGASVTLGVGSLMLAAAILTPIRPIFRLLPIVLIVTASIGTDDQIQAIRLVLESPVVAAALMMTSVLLVVGVVRPYLRARDPVTGGSPMAIIASRLTDDGDTTRPTATRLGAAIRHVFDRGAHQALERATARLETRATPRNRRRLLHAVLMPYENPTGVSLHGVGMIIGIGIFVALFVLRGAEPPPAFAAGYMSLIFARTRCAGIGQRFARMRAHLSDLYLAIAPTTRADFQKRIFDTLATIVPLVALQAVIGGAVLIALLDETRPIAMIGALAIAALGMGALDLSIELLGPQSKAGKALVMVCTLAFYVGAYFLCYGACVWFGTAIGLVAAGLPVLAAGASIIWLARDTFRQHPPIFDPPD